MNDPVKTEYTDEQAAHHEAGHAVASILAGVPFCFVTIDPDLRTGNKPGVRWPDRQPPPQEDRDARCRFYTNEVSIDFGGRIAESLVRKPAIPFPQANADFRLLPIPGDTANHDMQLAWKNFQQRERYCSGVRIPSVIEWHEKFEAAYKVVERSLLHPENRVKIEALAEALLEHRQLPYADARGVIERAS